MKKNRSVLNSPRLLELKKHNHKILKNKILFCILALFVIFSFLVYISRFPSLNIKEVQIIGNKIIETQNIKAVVNEKITGKYLWLFLKTNILLYPKNSIKKELANKYKRLKDISLSIKNNKILEISVAERTAKYIWCGETLPETDDVSQKCYFMDESGYIFDEAPYFSGEVYFKFYGSIVNTENPLGSYFSAINFKQLISLKNIMINLGLKPVAIYTTNDGDIQLFLTKGVSSAIGPKIIFKSNANFQKVAENLEAALTTEPFQSEFKNKYSSLLYIDLRYGNKVYYKFR